MQGNTVVDDTLNVLKNPERRRILQYFEAESVESVTIEELASHLASAKPDRPAAESRDQRTLEIRLHHVHLPKLADYGVLEFDARSDVIRYRSDPHVAELLACLPADR